MQILVSPSNDPFFNLALEETLLKDESLTDDILLFYVNDNTIVIGRNQNAHAEINHEYVSANHIKVIRRVSGGGAVYHDTGNINFSFITRNDYANSSYQSFLAPIVTFLASLGLVANFKGRNDLEINGQKFSGSAQYRWKNRMFHHGTILFDSNLTVLAQALKVDPLKFTSKAVQSVRQRVVNLRSLLKTDFDAATFLKQISDFFATQPGNSYFATPALSYLPNQVKALSNVRRSYDWTYVKNPPFNFSNKAKFDGGLISVEAQVENNIIMSVRFYGDFLSSVELEVVQAKLIDVPFTSVAIAKVLKSLVPWSDYFGALSITEVEDLFFGGDFA